MKLERNQPPLRKYNLTISHSKKFLWFRVAKVGTNSIKHTLKQISSEIDKPIGFLVDYDPHQFLDYYKFAFVRNPWDRLVSCWLDKVGTSNLFCFDPDEHCLMQKHFSRFVEFVSTKDLKNCDRHLKLQTELICLDGLDMLGTMENFRNDARQVFNKIGIESTIATVKNQSSNRQHYRDYYNDSLKEKVGNLYQQDIELLNYKF